MKDFAKYLVALMPELIDEASELYELFTGDADAALRYIQDRRSDIARARRERDARIDARFPRETE